MESVEGRLDDRLQSLVRGARRRLQISIIIRFYRSGEIGAHSLVAVNDDLVRVNRYRDDRFGAAAVAMIDVVVEAPSAEHID